MFFVHPVFLILSVCLSLGYYILLKGAKGLPFIFGMVPFCAAISLLNPFLNTQGGTVLFTYLNGRPFTLEALCYGAATGGMFFSVILWFACYNQIMTSDKFIFLFGRLIPSISLVLSMILRLVPSFERKIHEISGARVCVGRSVADGNKKERLKSGASVLSSLTSWALEGAVITADSMRCRGYGSGVRTSFAQYRLTVKDKAALILMLLGLAGILIGAIGGATAVTYTPFFSVSEQTALTIVSTASYAVFLSIPFVIDSLEEVKWHILKSKI